MTESGRKFLNCCTKVQPIFPFDLFSTLSYYTVFFFPDVVLYSFMYRKEIALFLGRLLQFPYRPEKAPNFIKDACHKTYLNLGSVSVLSKGL